MARRIHRRIYMDYASTTPIDKRVLTAMMPYLQEDFGNASAIYAEGRFAKLKIKEARTKIAELLNIRAEEIIFTGSGTEADNLALFGVFEIWKNIFSRENKKPHIITSVIEHPGILEICKKIEREGGEVTYIPVSEEGIVDIIKIKAALKPETILVSIMLANNEIGTIQPLKDISRIINDYKISRRDLEIQQGLHFAIPYLHTDASQAANYMDLSFQKLGVDMMTLDASKIYGPKGVGILASKRAIELAPQMLGGGQERGIRAGTENTAGIIGMTTALTLAQELREREVERLKMLQEYFISTVIKLVPGVLVNGSQAQRLPNNINICFPGIDGEFAVIQLDEAGISCSTASSCLNLSEEPYSYVIDALYKEKPEKKFCRSSSLRFTLGRATTQREIDLTLKKIAAIMITQ